jgi:HAD superfamily hydrolase (TIGR01490 family)
MKIAVFDFDGTIIREQSHQLFFKEIINSKGFIISKILKFYYKFIANKRLASLEEKHRKETILSLLKNKDFNYIQNFSRNFYYNKIKPLYIKRVIADIIKYKASGYKLVLISGGFDVYLHELFKDLKFDCIICSELQFIGDKFTGKIINKECLGEEKVRRLKKKIDLKKIDFNNSVFYSDHASDLPMFNLFKNNFLVCSGQDISWKKQDYKVIYV